MTIGFTALFGLAVFLAVWALFDLHRELFGLQEPLDETRREFLLLRVLLPYVQVVAEMLRRMRRWARNEATG